MMKNLPFLAPLRTFEAAARLGGFTQAAQALNITQGAASYQIKMLEERTGTTLFLRERRGLVLTSEGAQLLHSVVKALDILDSAMCQLETDRRRNTLALSVFSSFATKWLASRLSDLAAQFPDVDLRIFVEDHLVDFQAGERDAGVRYGKGPWPGLHATLMQRDEIFPVCSPRLLEKCAANDVTSLIRYPLLCESDRQAFDDGPDWHAWLRRAGHVVPSDAGPRNVSCIIFGPASVVLQAAIEGQGIALARGLLVTDDLAAGRLVPCSGPCIPSDSAYYFVWPEETPMLPKVEALKDWFMRAIGQTRHAGAKYLRDSRCERPSKPNGSPASDRNTAASRVARCG
jgi:LysR family glycine cleavage system transcriptional activator